MNVTFTVHGATADEIVTRAERLLADFAAHAGRRTEIVRIHVEPFTRTAEGTVTLWEAEVTATVARVTN